jgi:hypothetical protein
MRTEWWYDDSFVDPETLGLRDQEIFLARLTVNDDRSAEILFPNGAKKVFPSENDALIWMGDEEYRRLDSLIQHLTERGRLDDLPIVVPSGQTETEILRTMRIKVPVKN